MGRGGRGICKSGNAEEMFDGKSTGLEITNLACNGRVNEVENSSIATHFQRCKNKTN